MLQVINAFDFVLGYIWLLFHLIIVDSWISDFVAINQETHWAFSCGVPIFMNSTSTAKFKNILLNPYINCNFKPNYFYTYPLSKKKT